jgi:hypothetical protein
MKKNGFCSATSGLHGSTVLPFLISTEAYPGLDNPAATEEDQNGADETLNCPPPKIWRLQLYFRPREARGGTGVLTPSKAP